MKTIDMGNACVSCGHDTSFGSGRFVNRCFACISTGIDDVEKAYMTAWKLGCKGITIYRDQSKKDQVIEFGDHEKSKNKAEVTQGDPCPDCGEKLIAGEGCIKCVSCGFSYCEV